MFIHIPSLTKRKRIITYLQDFFNDHDLRDYNRAVGELAVFYEVKLPKTIWINSSDFPDHHGECDYANHTITLVLPESWKKRKAYNSCAKWINTVLHELNHFIMNVDGEQRANLFATRIVRGTDVIK